MLLFLKLSDKKEKVIKMPATKTIVETNENELPEDATPIDQVLNSRHRKSGSSGARKGRKESGGVLQPLGLPQMDKPDAGKTSQPWPFYIIGFI